MFKYSCGIIVKKNNKDEILYFIMFQTRKHANKISLIVNNGTDEGKNKMFKLLETLLNTKGWFIEASGAVSWIFRSKYNIPIIYNQTKIEELLDINIDMEKIVITPNFDLKDKNSNLYTYQYYKDGLIQFQNVETLFGVDGCIFNGDVCGRECQSS